MNYIAHTCQECWVGFGKCWNMFQFMSRHLKNYLKTKRQYKLQIKGLGWVVEGKGIKASKNTIKDKPTETHCSKREHGTYWSFKILKQD